MMRTAYSLIELVAALVASTVLIAGLAATITVSTQLLESPANDESDWRDREIADRLSADLRYAKSIQNDTGYGFSLTRPDPETGSDQTVTYQSYSDGLTRHVSGVPTMVLDPDSPGIQFSVDGYTAPTLYTAPSIARVRSTSTAASNVLVTSFVIDTPPGCKANDVLLICVAGKTPDDIGLPAGWQTIQSIGTANLRLSVAYRIFDSSVPASSTITSTNASALSAVMLSIEGASGSSPVGWNSTASGFGAPFIAGSKPSILQPPVITSDQLNLQVIAADGQPWPRSSIGLASFVDVGQATTTTGLTFSENSIGVAVRNGETPTLVETPRVLFDSFGSWLQVGIRMETSP